MSEIISFETEEMKNGRLLREADARNKKTLASAKRKLNNPNSCPLEKAKARLVIASLNFNNPFNEPSVSFINGCILASQVAVLFTEMSKYSAVAECFFRSLNKERIRNHVYHTRDKARADIFDYIEVFYNRARGHSHFNGISPEAFEDL